MKKIGFIYVLLIFTVEVAFSQKNIHEAYMGKKVNWKNYISENHPLRNVNCSTGELSVIPFNQGDTTQPLKIINPDNEVQFHVQGVINLIVRQHEVRICDKWDSEAVGLKVNGKIWSHEVEVKLTNWSDEVFYKSYKLMPLHQLESYIETNKHLPDIPTEEEVLKDGVKLSEMNALLLKKVEELTLYIINQQKRIHRLEKELER